MDIIDKRPNNINLHLLTPDLALSSLYSAAISLNFPPALIFSKASNTFDCFSHKICLT